MNLIRLFIIISLFTFIFNFNLTGPLLGNKKLYSISKDENYNSNSYYPFLIHFNLSFLNFDQEKYNLTKIKNVLLKTGKIFNQLLKTNEKYKISTHFLDLSHICNIRQLNGYTINETSSDIIIIPYFIRKFKTKKKIISSSICIINPKDKRPLLAFLKLSKKILLINDEEELLKLFTNRILFILGFEYFFKNHQNMGNFVTSYNNYQLKRVFYKYNGFSAKDYLFFMNLNKFELRNYRKYKKLDKDFFNGVMENKENRTLVFTEYILRYLQNLKYYIVNMDLCGCSLNGECTLDFFPYEIYVSPNNTILYCMRNDVYNKKCLNIKDNIISNKNNENKFIKNKNYFITNKCDNQDYNPKEINKQLLYKNELNITYQELELISPKKDEFCKCYPKTIFFKNEMEINDTIDKNYEITKKNITDKKYMVYSFVTHHRYPHTVAMREILNYNNIPILNDSFSPNFLFYETEEHFALEKISSLDKYTIFRGILKGHHLGPKDEAYYLYSEMQKKFPNDYNYMFESYFIPKEKKLIEKKFTNYSQSKNNLWLCKDSNGSLGLGIKFLKNITDFLKCKGIISKYLHNPHLYNGKKYHLRIYLVMTSIIPLKIYIYKEGKIIRASHIYKKDLNHIEDKNSFLTNNHLNFGKEGYEGDILTYELENLIKNEGGNWENIWSQIEDLGIKIILSNYENDYNEMKDFKLNKGIVFRYYGLDVIIDDNFKPWLLESNRFPFMELLDDVNKINKLGFTTSLLNLLGIVPFNHENGDVLKDEIKCNFNSDIEEMINNAFCEFNRPSGKLKKIFPIKENINYYKKFFKNPGRENLELWKVIENKK